MSEQPINPDITSDDKLWAALGYPTGIIAIIMLFIEEKKSRPFIKYHAVQAIAFDIVVWLIATILSTITLGIGAICLFPLAFLVTLWPAYEAYQGKYLELPFITNFIKNQGWA